MFDQASPSEDPFGDLGDPDLSVVDLLSAGTSSKTEMGFKRKPQASLFDLIEGQLGKDTLGMSPSNPPSPSPQPQPARTRFSPSRAQPSSTQSKLPALPQSTLPPRLEPTNLKRKRDSKGKGPMDGGKSRSSQEEGEALRVLKQLKIGHPGNGKEVGPQSAPSAWLPAPMLHGEPLMEDASLRSFRDGEGTYVADALERTLLLPTDMSELENMRMQEVFLSVKRYLGMVRLLILVTPSTFAHEFPFHSVFVPIGRPSRPLIGLRMRLRSRVSLWNLSVRSTWWLREPSKTPRLTSPRPGRT